MALPTTMTDGPLAPGSCPENRSSRSTRIYDYAFVTDREEGLVVVGPLHTLLDGDPRNNFVKRVGDLQPEGGVLTGATSMTLAGTVGYVTTPRGLVVARPRRPAAAAPARPGGAPLNGPAGGGRPVPLRVRARRARA